ncbi:hypothetical protein [Acetobacter sp. DsW_063]|uniref:hypothetical protein n=1 Tax=Acetobacter sp. DsW_063 TaxID=1514894 RepID=UPI0011773704|nr:hypothetical protein [Acetobacter sp. DsW_063]
MSTAETIAIEMQAIVKDAASPFIAGDTVGRQIDRAARVLGITAGQAKRFWYLEVKQVLAVEADRLRSWHTEWKSRQAAQLDHQFYILKARMAEMESWKNV